MAQVRGVFPMVMLNAQREQFEYLSSGASYGPWSQHATASIAAGKDCAYCGRYAVEPHGNCEGCGAPLNRREVKPL